jgi:chlorobactene glucosyltransferase
MSLISLVYVLLTCFLLIVISVIAIVNTLTFPRLHPVEQLSYPLVSIMIPARDEAGIISETIQSLLAQNYPDYEIILLDDNSTDGTAGLAHMAAEGDPRMKILHGAPLPAGWKGKNWACHQLSRAARGSLLVFTDADVFWSADALPAICAELRRSRADMLAVWPTQITETWGERLVVPLMGFAILAYLPVLAVHFITWPVFAAANGQCLVFQRAAYEQIGGHMAVREAIVDDMAFAYKVKRAGLRLRMSDGNRFVKTRMYRNWSEVRDGYAKNILAGYGDSILFLFSSVIFHWMLFVVPWFWLFISLLNSANPLLPVMLILLGVLTRALTAATTHQRVPDAFFLPVSVVLMSVITAYAIKWRFSGGPRWKGRIYHP